MKGAKEIAVTLVNILLILGHIEKCSKGAMNNFYLNRYSEKIDQTFL